MLRLPSFVAPARRLGLMVLAALACGCRNPEPGALVRQSGRAAGSWAATGRMISQRWLDRQVPGPYAATSLRAAARAVQTQRHALSRAAREDARAAAAVLQYDSLSATLRALASAVDAGERDSVAVRSHRLSAIDATIRRLSAPSAPTG
jgi:hypothetical protein